MKKRFLSKTCLLNNFVKIMIKRRKQHVQIIFTKKYFISLPSRGLSRQKKKERREIVLYHVFYHACNDVSLTSSNVLVTCDTTYRTGLCNTNSPFSKIALAEGGLETGFCMFTQVIHSWLITAEITDRFYAKYSFKKKKTENAPQLLRSLKQY